MITSKSHELIKKVTSLKEKKYRNLHGEFIVEGIKQIREAVFSELEIVHIFYSPLYNGEFQNHSCAVPVSEDVFSKLSEEVTPQGILAVLKIPHILCEKPEKNAILLDGISDPGNLGTIIRTANAAGYCDLYLRNCTDPYAPKCIRAAMSGIFFVRIHIVSDQDVLRFLSDIPMLCADMSGENLYEFSVPQPFCLVIGNEANGVSRFVRDQCNYTVRIPMRETCESLNAGVSAGILMYHLGYQK